MATTRLAASLSGRSAAAPHAWAPAEVLLPDDDPIVRSSASRDVATTAAGSSCSRSPRPVAVLLDLIAMTAWTPAIVETPRAVASRG